MTGHNQGASAYSQKWDVIIVGAGISGNCMAISMLKKMPNLKVLIIEKEKVSFKKVGESTSDLGAIYLNLMGIDHLLSKQVKKTGLSFIFEDGVEFLSPSYPSLANGYQLNREIFDTDLLNESISLGAISLKGCTVKEIKKLADYNIDVLVEDSSGEKNKLSTVWLIDCSGRTALLAKKMNWPANDELKFYTASSWGHFNKTKSWDDKKSWKESIGKKEDSTVHFMGKGYWVWHFPLNDNSLSLGIVYDKEVFKGEKPRDIFARITKENLFLKRILDGAELERFFHRDKLPYLYKKSCAKGLLSIGDSVGFTDPLFSPGLEIALQGIDQSSKILLSFFKDRSKFSFKKMKSYESSFYNAIESRIFTYRKRYQIMHHADIFISWARFDFMGYYALHVIPAVYFPSRALRKPVYLNTLSRGIYGFFIWRYLTIGEYRNINSVSSSEKDMDGNILYSKLSVPKEKYKAIGKITQLIYLWLKSYLLLEYRYLIFKLVKKS